MYLQNRKYKQELRFMKSIIMFALLFLSGSLFAQELSIKQVDTPPRLENFCVDSNTEDCFVKSLSIFVNRNLDFGKRNKMETGTAYVQFTITDEGNITGVRSRSKAPLLAAAAEKAISKITITEPATKDGKPVTISYTLPVSFRKIEIGDSNATVEDNSAIHDIPDVIHASKAPVMEGFDPTFESVTKTYKSYLRDELTKLNFTPKQIQDLKISFIMNQSGEIETPIIITPDKRLRKFARRMINNVKIIKAALDTNGQPIDVRVTYNFSSN